MKGDAPPTHVIITELFKIAVNLDEHLIELLREYGLLVYLILFLIIFLETGVVIFPFLPGDSLIFAAGALSSQGVQEGFTAIGLFAVLVTAAILGDSLNYAIGHFLGKKVYHKNLRWLNKEHLHRTEQFYKKHGGKTIIMARFLPIIRTFAPFVAGAGNMEYKRFLFYNIIGGIVWVGLFVSLGSFFGNLPWVKENFALLIGLIIVTSLIPPAIEGIRHTLQRKRKEKRAA